jgi:hypothetical protein
VLPRLRRWTLSPPPEPRPTARSHSLVAACLLLLLSACHREPAAVERLAELERAFEPASSLQSPPPPAPGAQSANAKTLVNQAMTALRDHQSADGVMLLQTAQKLPSLTAAQRMAVHQSIRAVTADLVERSSRGDSAAKDQLRRIESFMERN